MGWQYRCAVVFGSTTWPCVIQHVTQSVPAPFQVYCNMEIRGGGWERVAFYDSRQANATCPGDMVSYDMGPHHLCTNNGTNITQAQYQPVVERYSEVMGLMVGFASEDGDAFRPNGAPVQDLNGVYMEGLSLCINDGTGRLKHVFSVGTTNIVDSSLPTNCYLFAGETAQTPHVIGRDGHCAPLLVQHMMTLDGNLGPEVRPFGDRDSGACKELSMLCRYPSRYFIKQLANVYQYGVNLLVVRVISKGTIVIGMSHMDIYVR